ncbi:MAG: transglutaminase domain-containing protein, partial [Pseudohongiellaceae bacterium]
MSDWLLALFLSLLSLHLGLSMELPLLIWLGTGVSVLAALRITAIERPTWGLLFVLFSSGMIIGNQVLEDWAQEGSWPAENGVGAGFILCLLIYLLWLFAAKPGAARSDSSHPLDRDSQNILAWGLLLMLLMSPPDKAVVIWFDVAIAPISLAAMLVAAMVLLLDRCAGQLLSRLALLLPLLLVAPLSMVALESAQGPVITALGDLFPRSSNYSPTGFSPNQQLRASLFLRPSNRAVMRIQADESPVKYLAGNRLSLLDQNLVWLAEERPLLAINSFSADPVESGNYRYPMQNHHVTTGDDGSQSMTIHGLVNENYIFITPGTGYVTGSFESLIRNAADVWTPEFERGADRRWQLDPGNDPTAELRSPATLQLPDFWDAGLQERSQSLSGATPALTVENVLAYFQARPYSLSTNFDPEQPFHDFFLNERAGYCFWFASAAALALRANGIPSRLVG